MEIIELHDRPDLVNVVARWVHEEWGRFSGRPFQQTLERFSVADTAPAPHHSLLALEAGIPVGVATLRDRDSMDWIPSKGPWICNVYVIPEARGGSIASSLCKRLIAYAAERKIPEIFLATELETDSLYHRLGFTEVDRTHLAGRDFYLLSLTPGAGG